MSRDKGKLKISLLENGVHSLRRGIEAYQQYKEAGIRRRDPMLLKDAVMFLHHGIELLLKEMLARENAFLIFEELRGVAKKQKQADDLGIGIFFLTNPPRTVTYSEAIDRVTAFLRPNGLDDELCAKLSKLSDIRNQFEHYEVEADREQVVKLLADLVDSMSSFFEKNIRGFRKSWDHGLANTVMGMRQEAHRGSTLQLDVYNLVQRFKGQKVPGKLLNISGETELPTFNEFKQDVRPDPSVSLEVDILARGTDNGGHDVSWFIEVKGNADERLLDVLSQVASYAHVSKAAVWLVVLSNLTPKLRQQANDLGILLTGREEFEELTQFLQTSTHPSIG